MYKPSKTADDAKRLGTRPEIEPEVEVKEELFAPVEPETKPEPKSKK